MTKKLETEKLRALYNDPAQPAEELACLIPDLLDEVDQVRAERDSARAALAIVARDASRPRLESPEMKEARDTAADALLRVARLEDALSVAQDAIEHWTTTARQFCQNQETWHGRAEVAEAKLERVRKLVAEYFAARHQGEAWPRGEHFAGWVLDAIKDDPC